MKAGRLKYRITIERYTTTEEDPIGGGVKAWTTLCQPYADISFGTGQERREAAQESASAPATFHVRRSANTASVTPGDRIQFDGATWDITSAVPSKKFRQGVDITATRQVQA